MRGRPLLASLVAFAAGLVFAVGLAVSGMTHPRKIVGFLDPTAGWDPSLAFVMVGAIGVGAIAFRFILGRRRPIIADEFALPVARTIDAPLIAGAALFGLGWGLGGFCPGPAVVAVVTGAVPVLVFVGSMLAGMALFELFARSMSTSERGTRDDADEIGKIGEIENAGRNEANETAVSR